MNGESTPGGDVDRVRCCALGHEALPAAVLGLYDDGDQVEPDVPYCADCASAMMALGEYRVTRVLAPALHGTATGCPACGGTGQWPPPSLHVLPASAASDTAREVTALVKAFDNVPLPDLTALFYQHGYEELRLAVDALLAVIRSWPPPGTNAGT